MVNYTKQKKYDYTILLNDIVKKNEEKYKDDIYKKDIYKFTNELYKFQIDNDTEMKTTDFRFCKHLRNWVEKYIPKKRHVHITPRYSFKSTFWTHLYPLWKIYQDHNIKILFICRNADMASKRVQTIKNAIECNPQLKIGIGTIWNNSEIIVDRELNDPNPSVYGMGAQGAVTGLHPNICIVDDILDDDNCLTPERIQKVKDWWNTTVMPILGENSQIIVVGTRKHFNDLYAELLDNKLFSNCVEQAIIREPKRWDKIFNEDGEIIGVKIYDKDITGNPIDMGQIFCDECRTMEYYLMKKLNNEIAFLREYQNDPSAMSQGAIQNAWIKYYIRSGDILETEAYGKVNIKDLEIYMGVDVASSLKGRADWFCICTIGVDTQHNIYVLELYTAKLTFEHQLQAVKSKYDEWHPFMVNIDKVGYQMVLEQSLSYNTTIPFNTNIKPHGMKKELYYIPLGAIFQRGKIFIDEDIMKAPDNTGVSFRDELLASKCKHDDRKDALVLATELIPQSSMTSGSQTYVLERGGFNMQEHNIPFIDGRDSYSHRRT